MLKIKNIFKTVVATALAATTITAIAVPANASCTEWITLNEVGRYCDYTSGWCYWNNSNHSYFVTYKYQRACDSNNKISYQYKYGDVKTGCCS